ncbi:MAG: radical SAM protein [Streptosporangiaceae bacterium]
MPHGDQHDAVLALRAKMEILHHGVVPTELAMTRYGPPYLVKRRAYGNADDPAFLGRPLPQEAFLGEARLVTSLNVRSGSPWSLDWGPEGGFFLARSNVGWAVPVDFPRQPAFYDYPMPGGGTVKNVVTLYGGGSLGVFAYGSCALVDMGKACHYCSIEPNRGRGGDGFARVISETRLREALSLALADRDAPVRQVMINGGNFPDPDRSFTHYARLAAAAREVIDASGRPVELHLIVYPPANPGLYAQLSGLDVGVALNIEVFAPDVFARVCPGKADVSGQDHILASLREAAKILGPGHVFSILVGGLEPQASMARGMRALAGQGVTPIVNVFHADPGTPLHSHPEPTIGRITEMGTLQEALFGEFPFMRPFYLRCGRNSIDTEAYLGLFSALAQAPAHPGPGPGTLGAAGTAPA